MGAAPADPWPFVATATSPVDGPPGAIVGADKPEDPSAAPVLEPLGMTTVDPHAVARSAAASGNVILRADMASPSTSLTLTACAISTVGPMAEVRRAGLSGRTAPS